MSNKQFHLVCQTCLLASVYVYSLSNCIPKTILLNLPQMFCRVAVLKKIRKINRKNRKCFIVKCARFSEQLFIEQFRTTVPNVLGILIFMLTKAVVRRWSLKKDVLKNFANFTGKYLCWSLFLIRTCNFIKKRLQHRCFPMKFAKFLRTTILKRNYF